jgi:hypothetical protein
VKPSSRIHAIVMVLGVLSSAPTVGDVGGCGREARELDATEFAEARKEEDCLRCSECGIAAPRCARACDADASPEIVIPPTCRPLHHDGEVCLRALSAASCEDYVGYVDEIAPTAPSECRFCRAAPPELLLFDGGAP